MSDEHKQKGVYRIFISYAREDARALALKLRNDLVAVGQDAWLDTAEIGIGESWAQDVEEAIENCDIAVVLMSNAAYVSQACRAEQSRSLRKGKRVIPLLVQPDADRPLELETLNYLDFSDESRYAEGFQALLMAVYTGKMPEQATSSEAEDTTPTGPYVPPKAQTRPVRPITGERKRDSNAFRRYLEDLRGEPWLRERHWWTYFLFIYMDVHDVVDVLRAGHIAPHPPEERRQRGELDDTVRLYFRPRTPDLFGCEGIRPESLQPSAHVPVPVYLLFDLEEVITLAEARFSEGDVSQHPRTFSTAAAFRDLPFHRIYHDTWFRSPERDEILSARRAQVILPHALDLRHLRHIWARSTAEYATLLNLLPEDQRRRWGERINVRRDYRLFHDKWVYVNRADLSLDGALFQFNTCGAPEYEACGPFEIRADVTRTDGQTHVIDMGQMMPDDDLALDFTALSLHPGYALRLYLDDTLAYAGQFTADEPT